MPSLVADIGGTNSRVALVQNGNIRLDTVQRYENRHFPQGFEGVLQHYLAQHGISKCHSVCVAVAGPVRRNSAQMTNLSWFIDDDCLFRASGSRKNTLLNDLQAQAYSVDMLEGDQLVPLITSQTPANDDDCKLVIGAGTGFNVSPLFKTPLGKFAAPAEYGHVHMDVHTSQDYALAQYLEKNHGTCMIEEVLSGRGLEQVHAFLCHERQTGTPLKSHAIMQALMQGDGPAQETARIYIHHLARHIAYLGMIYLPYGGIYLCGGMINAFQPYLPRFDFERCFYNSVSNSPLLQEFNISIIKDDCAALHGCNAYLNQ